MQAVKWDSAFVVFWDNNQNSRYWGNKPLSNTGLEYLFPRKGRIVGLSSAKL